MKSERLCAAVLATGIFLGAGSGCGQEVAPFEEATVAVQWSVMPLGCASAEVDSVQVVLENRRNSYEATEDCKVGSVALDDVVPGSYELSLRGRSAAGHETFAKMIEDFAVRPGVDTVTDVVELEALPGSVQVNWEFAGTEDCETTGAQRVEIIAYDKGHHEAGRAMGRCDEGGLEFQELRAGDYLIYGRTIGADALFEGVVDTEIDRGRRADVTVELVDVSVE